LPHQGIYAPTSRPSDRYGCLGAADATDGKNAAPGFCYSATPLKNYSDPTFHVFYLFYPHEMIKSQNYCSCFLTVLNLVTAEKCLLKCFFETRVWKFRNIFVHYQFIPVCDKIELAAIKTKSI